MRLKRNQAASRAARQVRNWGGTPVTLTNFPGRVIWTGTLAELYAAPVVCGMPEPLLMSPTSKDPAVIGQRAIRNSLAGA
jgi:hypothetical protein